MGDAGRIEAGVRAGLQARAALSGRARRENRELQGDIGPESGFRERMADCSGLSHHQLPKYRRQSIRLEDLARFLNDFWLS
jgi:hypothetical protein